MGRLPSCILDCIRGTTPGGGRRSQEGRHPVTGIHKADTRAFTLFFIMLHYVGKHLLQCFFRLKRYNIPEDSSNTVKGLFTDNLHFCIEKGTRTFS